MLRLKLGQFIHYSDVIMGAMASQITSLTIVYSTVYSGADQRKHQSSASLAFVREIHRWPVNSPRKWPVTRNLVNYFGVNDVIQKGCWDLTKSRKTLSVKLNQSINLNDDCLIPLFSRVEVPRRIFLSSWEPFIHAKVKAFLFCVMRMYCLCYDAVCSLNTWLFDGRHGRYTW